MNGKFMIKSAQFTGYALNVYGTSVASGKNVCLFPSNTNDPMQLWIPQAQGNNIYKLSTAQASSCEIVLDHYRLAPVDNCDMYTSAGSNSNGTPTVDLMDQQIQFEQGSDGYYTIYLYEGGKKSKVLTCAASVNSDGVGKPSSLNVTNNVYWAAPSTSLGKRQKWTVSWITPKSGDKVLAHAQAYVQRDATWAYLARKNTVSFSGYGCGVCALTTCGAIIKKSNAITPQTCLDDGGFTETDLSAQWYVYGISGTPVCSGKPAEAYKRIYKEITAGNPVVVRVVKPSFEHFVTAYGYTMGTTESNITPSRILIIDPYNPEFTNLQELLNGSTFKFIYVKA